MDRPKPPLGFAHRGARADAPENTVAAFALARQLGASGVESDVWRTADGELICDHEGVVRVRGRSRRIAELPARSLPAYLPSLGQLLEACGPLSQISLDVKDPDPRTARAVLAAVAGWGGEGTGRLWLCGRGLVPAAWRRLDADVHLVSDTRRPDLAGGMAAHVVRLREAGVEVVNLRGLFWTRRRVEVVHAGGLLAFAWKAQSTRRLDRVLGLGCDAVYSDHVTRMMTAIRDIDARPGVRGG